MKVIVQFSGGKDSLASLIWACEEFGYKNVTAVFCDTSWEHELTYIHINEVTKALGVELITLKGKYTFLELVRKKLRFPSTKARFCTEYLKIHPFIDWLLQQESSYLIIQGIRADESRSRSKMEKECRYFKYYFEPYGYDKKGKPKYMNYHKKAVKKWLEKYEADILRPFLTKTANDVMAYIIANGLKPNPLYYMGFKRVGCFPCIMCSKSEMQLIIEKQPKYLDRIKEAETEFQSTFFAIDYIPKYARENFTTRKGVFKVPTIGAVINYLKGREKMMFKEEESTKSCMSVYNICE